MPDTRIPSPSRVESSRVDVASCIASGCESGFRPGMFKDAECDRSRVVVKKHPFPRPRHTHIAFAPSNPLRCVHAVVLGVESQGVGSMRGPLLFSFPTQPPSQSLRRRPPTRFHVLILYRAEFSLGNHPTANSVDLCRSSFFQVRVTTLSHCLRCLQAYP